MKLLLATFKHETNTFSPVETKVPQFSNGSDTLITGEEAIRIRRGTGTGIGGFMDVAQRYGAEISIAVVADAHPSGLVDAATYQKISQAILDAAREPFDGILLDLHGAMVVDGIEDGDGHLLQEIRKLQPTTPIGACLDMHANVTEAIVTHATAIAGYHTYPHLDIYETGVRVAEIICRTIQGEIHPVMAWGQRPMISHVMRQGTHQEPNKSLQARCAKAEEGDALAASLFVGFPNADTADTGLSVVICTDDAKEQATTLCESLLDEAWARRAEFVYPGSPLADAMKQAVAASQRCKPVFLLDHYDNCASGATMDTTAVLRAVIEHKLEKGVFYGIHDPQAVQQAIAAGVGNRVEVDLGGKGDLSSINEVNQPLRVSATVRLISDGRFRLKGPMNANVETTTGPTVVLDTGRILIVVISGYIEPNDEHCFSSLGIPMDDMQYIILKSRVHWRAGFMGRVKEVVECDGVGVATSNYARMPFKRLRRPIYPLDEM